MVVAMEYIFGVFYPFFFVFSLLFGLVYFVYEFG